MSEAVSLTRFISIRLITAGLVICVLWYFVARDLYWMALDGTSSFYLFEDAHQALQVHQSGLDVSSLNTPFKQFYLEKNHLPEDIRTHLEREDPHKNEVSLLLTEHEDIYLLPYAAEAADPLIYVVHRFEKQETQDISPVLFLISFAVLFLMFALMGFVVTRLQQQSRQLSTALQAVEQAENISKASFDIQEFQGIYDDVKEAYQQRLKVLQREKYYSAFLSHEIRHSLASINASIEKLDQIDGFPLDALAPMDEAKQQSLELQRIANAILALWQTERLTSSSVSVTQELTLLSAALDFRNVVIQWQIESSEYTVQCDKNLFHLLLKQLLQNARQYAKSALKISLNNDKLTLWNDVNPTPGIDDKQQEYGHQVGMFLIEKICDTLGWGLQVHNSKSEFAVTIHFG